LSESSAITAVSGASVLAGLSEGLLLSAAEVSKIPVGLTMGLAVGLIEGSMSGVTAGLMVGLIEGLILGLTLGFMLGFMLGLTLVTTGVILSVISVSELWPVFSFLEQADRRININSIKYNNMSDLRFNLSYTFLFMISLQEIANSATKATLLFSQIFTFIIIKKGNVKNKSA
jgi:hypothetical protein